LTGVEPGDDDVPALTSINRAFEPLAVRQRVEQAVELLPGEHVLTSSFGAQAAVMLHLVNEVIPGIPVILLDTGYLFPETYRFIDQLTEQLKLNLKVFRADSSPAWQESRFGKLWDQGLDGIERYNRINKLEPLERALLELEAGTWFAGLRRAQTQTRSTIVPIEFKRGRYKVHPFRLERPGHRPLLERSSPPVSSPVGEGLFVDWRLAYHPLAERRGQHGRASILRPETRVRPARMRRATVAPYPTSILSLTAPSMTAMHARVIRGGSRIAAREASKTPGMDPSKREPRMLKFTCPKTA